MAPGGSSTSRSAAKPGIIDTLLAKYRADPEGFRRYLPEIAAELDAMFPSRGLRRSPFVLTDQERHRRLGLLKEAVVRLDTGSLSKEGAVDLLEHCAALIEDDSLPDEVTHDSLVGVIRAAIGIAPSSIKRVTTMQLKDEAEYKVVQELSIVRGVTLGLTWDGRVVSITVNPSKVRERSKLMAFVGKGRADAADVAAKHDDYLAEAYERGAP